VKNSQFCNRVEILDGKAVRQLAMGFDIKVPCVLQLRLHPKTIGNALKFLIPHLFSSEDLVKGGVEALDTDKVAALVGEIFCFHFFFFFFFFPSPFFFFLLLFS